MEALKEIKLDPDLHRLPLLMLSTGDNRADIDKAYSLGASGYLKKPNHFDDWIAMAQSLVNFWKMHVTY